MDVAPIMERLQKAETEEEAQMAFLSLFSDPLVPPPPRKNTATFGGGTLERAALATTSRTSRTRDGGDSTTS